MLTKEGVRRWYIVHTWTSLISTVFVLIACLTGLPLVFHHEIEHWFSERAELNEAAAPPTLDELLSNARAARPGMQPQVVMHDPGAAETTYVAMGESVDAPVTQAELLQFDRATGTLLRGSRYDEGFMGFMLRLHVELFAGLPGTLFLGIMSLVFLVALVSGVAAPLGLADRPGRRYQLRIGLRTRGGRVLGRHGGALPGRSGRLLPLAGGPAAGPPSRRTAGHRRCRHRSRAISWTHYRRPSPGWPVTWSTQ